MGFSRQEYWNGLPFPPPGDLSDPGIKPRFPASSTLAGGFFTTGITWETAFPPPPGKLLNFPGVSFFSYKNTSHIGLGPHSHELI